VNKSKVALVFDDGFLKSSLATAEIFERHNLRAAFAVLANTEGFAPNYRCGDFGLWNELQARGHIIQPHGYTHANLKEMNHADAIDQLERCLDTFGQKLQNFDPRRAVYCFAYNQGTPSLCDWLLQRVGAVRIGGSGLLNQADVDSRLWHSRTHGPEDPTEDLTALLQQARGERASAVAYCLHGLDGEAWGAIASGSLERVLQIVTSAAELKYRPLSLGEWH
jgi:peptidoglycan/xylan/chitin deacetylase (PgdA/CDA1 family)